MTSKLFTIGYEGLHQHSVIARLRAAEVELLIDVRYRPLSRKPGLSKRKLAAALDEAGIAYAHNSGLGTPPELLREVRATGVYDWDRYREHLAGQSEAMLWALDLAAHRPVGLLCFEALPVECHRHVVAHELSVTLRQSVINL